VLRQIADGVLVHQSQFILSNASAHAWQLESVAQLSERGGTPG
jgi:hypothetical protein